MQWTEQRSFSQSHDLLVVEVFRRLLVVSQRQEFAVFVVEGTPHRTVMADLLKLVVKEVPLGVEVEAFRTSWLSFFTF